MQHKILLLVILSVSASITLAQTKEIHYRVNFDTDKYDLDSASVMVLNEIVKEYSRSGYCELNLSAHTDNTATSSYNLELSSNRASVVEEYLTSHGLERSRINTLSFGEQKPVSTNINEEGRQENRRVDIILRRFDFKNIGELVEEIAPEKKQEFKVNKKEECVIKGRSGTVMHIPADAFVAADSSSIDGKYVNVVLEEYLQPGDAVFKELSTISDGKILQSGGMFSVSAFADGKELVMKQGKSIQVELPADARMNDMKVFTPVRNENGITEWKETEVPFIAPANEKQNVPFVKLDTAYLSSLLATINYDEEKNLVNTYKLPQYPVPPVKPSAPKKPALPSIADLRNSRERLFMTAKTKKKIVEQERIKREKQYEKLLKRYNEKMEEYEVAQGKFQDDSMNYEERTKDALKMWAGNQRLINRNLAMAYHQQRSNNAIRKLIELSNSNQLTSTDLKNFFRRLVISNSYLNNKVAKHSQAATELESLMVSSAAHIYNRRSSKGLIEVSKLRNRRCDVYSSYDQYNNTILDSNQIFYAELSSAEDELIAEREKRGLINQSDVINVYTAALQSFGTFNCDRFYNSQQMAEVKVQYNGDARILFYVPSINGYIYASKQKDHYVTSLPVGLEATMVVIDFNEKEGPKFLKENKRIRKNEIIKPVPERTTLKEMREAIASL